MTDLDLEYESDFEELEVPETEKKGAVNHKANYDYEDESVHLDSPKNKHSPAPIKNLVEKKAPESEKNSDHESEYENEYENEFYEESEEEKPKVIQQKVEKSWKPPISNPSSSESNRGLSNRGNSSNTRNVKVNDNPGFSVSPLKMASKIDIKKQKPPLSNVSAKAPSQKGSLLMSKNSTQENLKVKVEYPIKKNKQLLEKENRKLREDLKALNEQLSHYLEFATEEIKNKGKKEKKIDSKANQDQMIDKKLKIYQDEYKTIKEKYDRVNDTKYINELREEIKKKDSLILEFEKRNKYLVQNQRVSSKKIENYDEKQFAGDKLKYTQLQEEFSNIDEQIKQIEEQIFKEEEWYEVNQKKEVELIKKLENFKPEEYQTQYNDNKLNAKYSKLKTKMQNIEVNHTSMLSQLKVQEHTAKAQKESYLKELAQLQEKIKERTEEVRKLRFELDDTVMLASHHKMGKFVSLLNARPQSEKGISDSSENLNVDKDLNHSKGPKEENDLNKSSNQIKARSEVDLGLKPKFTVEKKDKSKVKINDSDIEEDIPLAYEEKKPGFLASLEESTEKIKPKKNQPNKEEPKKKSILEELEEESVLKTQAKNEPKKKSILEELESEANDQGFKIKPSQNKKAENPTKPSIFEELESETRQHSYNNQNSLNKKPENFNKPSIFEELEAPSSNLGFKNPEPTKKSSILEELEDKPGFTEPTNKRPSMFRQPSREKPNLFMDNEKKQEISGFNPIRAPSDELFGKKESRNGESRRKIGLFEDLESKKEDNIWAKVENKGKMDLYPDESEKKPDIFGNINLPEPNSKRNRGHLKKEIEKKDEKIAALASNAANHDFFGGFLENNEDKPITSSLQSKLLPVRLDSQEKKQDSLFRNNENDFKKPQFEGGFKPFIENDNKRNEPVMEFRKPVAKVESKKNFDLDEEDLLL